MIRRAARTKTVRADIRDHDDDWVAVRFDYMPGHGPEVVADLKDAVPAFAREWHPDDLAWLIDRKYVADVEQVLIDYGYTVKRLDTTP